jgi:hypothetical protein
MKLRSGLGLFPAVMVATESGVRASGSFATGRSEAQRGVNMVAPRAGSSFASTGLDGRVCEDVRAGPGPGEEGVDGSG